MEVKLRAGDYLIPATLTYVGDRIEFAFGFSKTLQLEVKAMEGAKWHGYDTVPRKVWSVKNSLRNAFQLERMKNNNPHKWYDQEVQIVKPTRTLRDHQCQMFNAAWTYKHHIIAGEMGTGKTLVAIELMEKAAKEWTLTDDEIWYVGPKAACKAVKLELKKWDATISPHMMTYDELVKVVKTWTINKKAPRVVIYDESSKIKTATAQRTQSAIHVAHSVIKEHSHNSIILLMSGTPAPKSPVDWWSQTECACPGFIRESDTNKMRASLAISEQREGAGGMYPHHVAWLDDESRCAKCGQPESGDKHANFIPKQSVDAIRTAMTGFKAGDTSGVSKVVTVDVKDSTIEDHAFVKSVNEIARLYRRMRGLVTVVFKKDCGDLPEKEYREINVQPTVDMLRAARLIKNTQDRVITALAMMRELSDGFQYKEMPTGIYHMCGTCAGSCQVISGQAVSTDTPTADLGKQEIIKIDCPHCSGSGKVEQYERIAVEIGSPKDAELIELLDTVEDMGRVVVWAGFEGSINRLVKIVLSEGWTVLKVDGKGWVGTGADGSRLDADELLIAMDGSHKRRKELLEKYPKLAFIGNPEAGGMAITLTAAFMCIYYSNSFNGEARSQSEDRIHRLGMEVNRGCIIVDLFCLASDVLVRTNLKAKRRLELITMGELIL